MLSPCSERKGREKEEKTYETEELLDFIHGAAKSENDQIGRALLLKRLQRKMKKGCMKGREGENPLRQCMT